MEHYGTAILPCGVKKPRQKNSTENSVYNVALSIIARLRDTEFTSFVALKLAVSKKLEEMNNKPFEKRNGSRRSDFEENERRACMRGKRTLFCRMQDLLLDYDCIETPLQRKKFLKKMARYDLLIIDEWLGDKLTEAQLNVHLILQ